ncbi:sigma-54-dependent Fis family transcriptional regulator [Cupriavidus basilensis]|uniref:Sigma-54-dependent Fis family transcriptional regulator n=1 Tax=Cupriavidus basilensis TaxID=68895 RepID=A0ABT6ATD1_9BURK|nr:sigma-54-dependent Fis family transcriptional regulator [Cupriavidus basilensis]MDF3835848.1 sigma-54-dependent Fis family transcriptional regulator [Cupriavidus basilensis]
MPTRALEQMFSRPENDGRVMSAWERFQCGREADSSTLRRLIDDSWRRCQQASVNPDRANAPLPMSEDKLHLLRDQCAELLGASTPVMALARDFLTETGTVMVLTDARGTVLNLEGDTSTLGAAENVHLISGADWSEPACGTNAIGTTLEIGQPVQIHSAEHYCEGIKRWSCSATVIRDPLDNSTLGVLDVSGLTTSYSRHALALVVSTAARIEGRLAQSELDIRCSLLEACIERVTDNMSDGVILFDRRGRAIKANGLATQMLTELGRADGRPAGPRLAEITIGGNGVPITLPAWASRDWLEPVMVSGRQVGALLTLPFRQRVRGTAWSVSEPVAASSDRSFERVIGHSAAIQQTISRARHLGKSRVPVLLLGETGVGKEVFARGIHEANADKSAPFVALNCGGLSRELLSSELFGHAEGSFTGAKRGGMIGKIEAADGGTLFLDEIGEMPIDLQPHFLRVLEESEVYRLGENKARKVSFRLIAATHRDLRRQISDGHFRMDLFYRIAVTSINIPPLRERADDIPLLVEHYLKLLSRQHGLESVQVTPGVLELLQHYAWPGNVREFRNVIENMLLTAGSTLITEADLPVELFQTQAGERERMAVNNGRRPRVLTRLEAAERGALYEAIRQCEGNMTAVARHLGIARSTLYLKLERFGLDGVVDELRSSSSGGQVIPGKPPGYFAASFAS